MRGDRSEMRASRDSGGDAVSGRVKARPSSAPHRSLPVRGCTTPGCFTVGWEGSGVKGQESFLRFQSLRSPWGQGSGVKGRAERLGSASDDVSSS
ncbi:unnamed protein product [Gadus morhua 'NCC']